MPPLVETAATVGALGLPVAHLGHWLWCFYVVPILIVVGGIIYTTRVGNRREREGKGKGKK